MMDAPYHSAAALTICLPCHWVEGCPGQPANHFGTQLPVKIAGERMNSFAETRKPHNF